MAWDQLSINKPHLVYIILGGFTTLFMLCSSVIKERLYIGEATVATLCGIIFGPHAADLINPGTWGNTDQITEEFSRIVLVVQCFAIGVELPKAYMERHWRSVTALLVPVMTFGWLISSLFIWGLFTPHLNWLDSLVVAACVTATDPVLASSVVGKGKFAKRVPKHLRDLISAESGCNDGMAFPFVYLALYIVRYKGHPDEVSLHWFCVSILYECVFGCIYGVIIGYVARRAVRYAHENSLIDRESFLVFYFVLALFCAGSGSLLGMDDLLIGFACGVGFSNDGWFTSETEESHVSNVIDLLLNLSFFVYFGTIIPWELFNSGYMGLEVWRLVVIAILILLFRRIPAMLAFKVFIPDIKTWREALFAGHFGPMGVGAIFIAILARAELETETTTPLRVLPDESFPHDNIIVLIWPIVTFLVLCSIVVHGSSIAVFTLGKHINTLTLTMSYTTANESSWMDRLPRLQSRSKSSMSMQRSDSSFDAEKSAYPPLGPPGTFLRRQREEDNPSRAGSRANSRAPSRHRARRSRNWESSHGPGGPVSQSAIAPARRQETPDNDRGRSDSDTLALKSDPPSEEKTSSPTSEKEDRDGSDNDATPGEIYEEGGETVYEDEDGNVLAVEPSHGEKDPQDREKWEESEGRRLMHKSHADEHHGVAPVETPHKDHQKTHHRTKFDADHDAEKDKEKTAAESEKQPDSQRPGPHWLSGLHKIGGSVNLFNRKDDDVSKSRREKPRETRGPARAYQYGNTIIVEDGDGEVIRKYDIPAPGGKHKDNHADPTRSKQRVGHMGRLLGLGAKESKAVAAADASSADAKEQHANASGSGKPEGASSGENEDDDHRVRFISTGGQRMSKAEFIDQMLSLDPKSRVEAVEDSNAPESVKKEARKDAHEQAHASGRESSGRESSGLGLTRGLSRVMSGRGKSSKQAPAEPEEPIAEREEEHDDSVDQPKQSDSRDSNSLHHVESSQKEVPSHNVSAELRRLQRRSGNNGESAADRRRRLAAQQSGNREEDSEDDGTERVPPAATRGRKGPSDATSATLPDDTGETAAERRRRLGALGLAGAADSDSDEDDAPRAQPPAAGGNIRFAEPETEARRTPALRWGKNVGR